MSIPQLGNSFMSDILVAAYFFTEVVLPSIMNRPIGCPGNGQLSQGYTGPLPFPGCNGQNPPTYNGQPSLFSGGTCPNSNGQGYPQQQSIENFDIWTQYINCGYDVGDFNIHNEKLQAANGTLFIERDFNKDGEITLDEFKSKEMFDAAIVFGSQVSPASMNEHIEKL
ncbi:MAG: hypothetical protein PHC64_11120, partial [Candidatus Gastranaerophilales bacterium]|nr:hypothetical protein [Candidatus Gastranaerophilales bacterium]